MVEENRYDNENIRKDMLGERDETVSGTGRIGSRGSGTSQWSSQEGSLHHKSFRESSPDEVREMMKERVAKGIAAVTGALEGFIERSRGGELPKKTREAIESAGETSREAIATTSEQVSRTADVASEKLRETRSNVEKSGVVDRAKDALHKAGDTTRGVTQAFKEETQKTKDTLGRKGASSPHMGGTTGMPTSTYNERGSSGGLGSSNLGGSKLSETSNTLDDVPDLRKTKLGTQKDILDAEDR
jgi:hypothetical protein